MKELNKQFILINNTRPLAKRLIYELLPSVSGLPHRLSDRAGAAAMTETLNYGEDSSLRGLIHPHTNTEGIIKDTLIQRPLINSFVNRALRPWSKEKKLDAYDLVNAFFAAVKDTFAKDWEGHTATTSRLLHGAGVARWVMLWTS